MQQPAPATLCLPSLPSLRLRPGAARLQTARGGRPTRRPRGRENGWGVTHGGAGQGAFKFLSVRYTAVQDAGKAIHPSYVEGQIQGGAAQGIGWALNEEYVFNAKGHMLNCSFLDYRMPVCLDLPMLDTVIVEAPNPNHPYGVRGVGETSVIPPLAAITNAVSHGIGVRLNRLPLSPGRILAALWENDAATNGTHGK